ncbi:MAG: SPFH domain-containing protein [Thermomicrobiales bacterium]|nr:SPFH domain-containing protein [Thermomicrobiales bacterium]
MALLDLIEFPDASGQEMVHRVPEYGSGEFTLGSQLVVRESQAAIFFRDGKALDVFGAGRHTLSTNNIPILSSIFGIPFGGKSPFRAEVYFVSLREFIDMKWGTPQPILFRDTDLGMVRLRAFGTYSMQIADPQLFVNKMVGQQGTYDTGQIQDYLRNSIVQQLTTILGQLMKSILDLPAQYNNIAAATRAAVMADYSALGLQLRGFQVAAITPPEEVQKFIDQRSSMGALGDMNRYTQFQTAQAIRDAANNPGTGEGQGAGIGAGLGLGIGMGMAQQMQQAMQGGQQGYQQQPPQGYQQQPPQGYQQPQGAPPQSQGYAPPQGAPQDQAPAQGQGAAGGKFCTECGTRNQPGAKFCSNCGHPMGG